MGKKKFLKGIWISQWKCDYSLFNFTIGHHPIREFFELFTLTFSQSKKFPDIKDMSKQICFLYV